MKKNVIAGLGEIGNPILKLISKHEIAIGYDVNEKLIDKKLYKKFQGLSTSFLHICIPFNEKFIENVLNLSRKFSPEIIVVHSTVSPGTTKRIQSKTNIPIIYSATRGIHKRMLLDIKEYTKFFAIEKSKSNTNKASLAYSNLMKRCEIQTKKMSKPITLELAKIVCDTSYYGWLITYAQLSNMIAIENGVNYDEMWSFSDEIHKRLGNRPKMYPGVIGGHCVIPNLDLIHNRTLNLIRDINELYVKSIPNAKLINKKYDKSKKQSYTI